MADGLHVLLLCERFFPEARGGAGRAAGDLAAALCGAGCRIDALVPAPDGHAARHAPMPGMQVFDLPVGEGPMPPRAVNQLIRALEKHVDFPGIRVIHDNGGFFPPLLPLEEHLARRLNVPFVVQFQIQWRPLLTVKGFAQPVIDARIAQQQRLAEMARRVIFVSKDEAREGIETFKIPPHKCTLSPNPIVPERYADLPTRPHNDPPVIGLAGRLDAPSKGARIALEALAMLAPSERFSIQILGNPPAPGLIPPELRDRLHCTGWLDARSTAATLAGLDLFLMPSRYEPFGLLAAEALAAGTPVIVSATGGLSEIVEHEASGLHVPLDAGRDAWCAAITRCLQLPAQCAAWAATGRAHVLNRYAAPRVANEALQLFQSLLQGETPHA